MPKASKTSSVPNAQRRRRVVKNAAAGNWVPFGYITQKQLDAGLAYVKKMTPAEKVESLKACGVLTPSGRLAKRYRS